MERQPSYMNEKVPYMEPNLQYQRESMSKALPSPPPTSRKIKRKLRVGAGVVGLFGVVSVVLTLLIVSAGKKPGYLAEEYLLKLNTSRVGQDIIRFDTATSTTPATPSATTSSTSNPLDPLNPFSTASPLNPNNPNNPLNQLTNSLEPILGNLTDGINNALGDAVNRVVDGLVEQAGVKDFYYLYQNSICEGNLANGTGRNTDGVVVDKCSSYDDQAAGLNAILPRIQSSVVIGTTNISIPLIAQLTRSIDSLSSDITALRGAVFAFLIISVVSSAVNVLLAIPSIIFSAARLLVYANLFFSNLAALAAFLGAVLLTGLILVVASLTSGFGEAVGLLIGKGERVLAFLWVSWACLLVASIYWDLVWFVEVRRWSFVKRRRSDDQVGNWRGLRGEVWQDLKGEKSI